MFSYSLPLFSLILLSPVQSDLTTCQTDLEQVLIRFTTLVPNDTYSEMAVYSGKWINDLGNYFDCNDVKEATYAIFMVEMPPTPGFVALCGPGSCTVDDYYALLEGNTESVRVRDFMKEIRRVKPGIDMREEEKALPVPVKIVFPKHYIQEHFGTLNAGAVVMLVICVLLGVIMMTGTVIDLNRQFGIVQREKKDGKNGESAEGYLPMTVVNSDDKSSVHSSPPPSSLLTDLLLCFSLYTNFKKLFTSRSSEKLGKRETLDILNGIRVMSMGWVILGHTFVLIMSCPPIKNPDDLVDSLKKVKMTMIYSAFFSVDTFFLLSGLLMAFLLCQQLDSPKGMSPKGWVYLYFHRFYRILPAYMFVLFFVWAFTKYMGNGPVWFLGDYINDPCHDNWWTNVLFLNNFLPTFQGSECLHQSWYLANDMQFFWLSPPLFYIYSKVHKVAGWVLLNLAVALAVVSSAVIADVKDYNIVTMANGMGTENGDIYIKPYCRAAPYAIGIMCGLILYTHRNYAKTGKIYDNWAFYLGNLLENRYIRYAGYLLGLFFINFFIFIQFTAYRDVDNGWTSWTRGEIAAFYGFSRPCWGLGISLLFLPMLLGHWKLVAWFLSLDIWTPLARLTFCTYLVHLNLGSIYFNSKNTAYWFDDLNITIDFFFITLTSYAAAIPLTLAVESPFMALEKVMKSGKKRNGS